MCDALPAAKGKIMSTKMQRNPNMVKRLKGKSFKQATFKKQERFKIKIRSNLKHKKRSELLLMQKQKQEDAA